MSRFGIWPLVSAVLCRVAVAACAQADEPVSPVAKDLQAYYKGTLAQPPYQDALARLESAEAAVRVKAARYLIDLLDQTLRDEVSGKAPWQPTPFWGESWRNQARELREWLIKGLSNARPTPEALLVARCVLEKERISEFKIQALDLVKRTEGPEANALLQELATPRQRNGIVLAEVLKEIGRRKLPVPADRLGPLCNHHRQSVRDAARQINKALGRPKPPPFDPAEAMRSEPIRKLLEQLSFLILEPAPADAPWLRVTTSYFKPDRKTIEFRQLSGGWLLEKKNGIYFVCSPWNRIEQFREQREPQSVHGGQPITCQVELQDIAREVERVLKRQKVHDNDYEVSPRGGFVGEAEQHPAGIYEGLLVDWLFRNGRHELAAKVLFSALDSLPSDENLLNAVRAELGYKYGTQMLAAFVNRDYPKALERANLINKRYPETMFSSYAAELKRQLPLRRNDFKEFRLPTPAEWAALKQKLSRAEQIDYLCRRFRLINCFQEGQPGHAADSDPQFAEPSRIWEDASFKDYAVGNGKTEVINPLVELAGPIDRYFEPGKKRPTGMALTLADIKYLAPHLRDDWFMLTISFFRSFARGRTLHSTRPLLAHVINDLAKKDLCQVEAMSSMTEEQRDRQIQAIIRWALEKANKSEVDLLLEALDEQVQKALKEGVHTGQRWKELTSPAESLVELKVKRALPALLRLVEVSSAKAKKLPVGIRPPLNNFQETEILRLCRKLDREGTSKGIQVFLTSPDAGLRAQAALVLFQTGEKEKAREVLGGALEQAGGRGDVSKTLLGWMFPDAIKELMDDGTPESQKAAARILKNGDFTWIGSRDRVPILRRFADAKMTEPYQFYLNILDIKGSKLHGFDYRDPVAEVFAGEVLYEFAPNQPGNTRRDPNRNASKEVAEARSWLHERIRELETRNHKNP